jgi:hypothetical protein
MVLGTISKRNRQEDLSFSRQQKSTTTTTKSSDCISHIKYKYPKTRIKKVYRNQKQKHERRKQI